MKTLKNVRCLFFFLKNQTYVMKCTLLTMFCLHHSIFFILFILKIADFYPHLHLGSLLDGKAENCLQCALKNLKHRYSEFGWWMQHFCGLSLIQNVLKLNLQFKKKYAFQYFILNQLEL